MKKNPSTGLYECTKFYRSTSTLLMGTGATKEEAQADLKKKKAEYNSTPLMPVGTFNSPGFSRFQNGARVALRFNPERQAAIRVHPMSSLANQDTPDKED